MRVPPLSAAYDNRPSNDRYDAWKVFDCENRRIGVGLEIEHWEIQNDLLKFLRGHSRGQIAAGVVLHANPSEVRYAYEHVLRMTENPIPTTDRCPSASLRSLLGGGGARFKPRQRFAPQRRRRPARPL